MFRCFFVWIRVPTIKVTLGQIVDTMLSINVFTVCNFSFYLIFYFLCYYPIKFFLNLFWVFAVKYSEICVSIILLSRIKPDLVALLWYSVYFTSTDIAFCSNYLYAYLADWHLKDISIAFINECTIFNCWWINLLKLNPFMELFMFTSSLIKSSFIIEKTV